MGIKEITMKNIKSVIVIGAMLLGFNYSAQTIKYKEIYSMIKSGKTSEALPHLVTFLKEEPKHANGNYWAGKIYYEKANANKSSQQADSSILYFKQGVENLSELDLNPLNASRFPDVTGEDMAVKVENGKKWMQSKISEMEALKIQLVKSERVVGNNKQTENVKINNKPKNNKVTQPTKIVVSPNLTKQPDFEKRYKDEIFKAESLSDYYAERGRFLSADSIFESNIINWEVEVVRKERTKVKNDSLHTVLNKTQLAFQASNKCPNCAENGAKEFIKKLLVGFDKELLTATGREKGKLEDAKQFYNESLKNNKFIPYYYSNTMAQVIIDYKKPGMGSVHPIRLIKENGKWIGLEKHDKLEEKFNPSKEEDELFQLWNRTLPESK